MANPSMFSPTSPHFFQPLLPNFQRHLKIPIEFFSEHIKGKNENKTVSLRSDASNKIWEMKMESNRLTKGWKEFVDAHDFRVGDILVFRHDGGMKFHVTALGPSCCEIEYEKFGNHEEDEETNDTVSDTEIASRSKKEVEIVEIDIESESDQSSPDLNCFSLSVTASNLERDHVAVPIAFSRRNGLVKERQDTVLMNEEGKSWPAEITSSRSDRVSLVHGWTTFCTANKLLAGDSCTFKLLQSTEKPVFKLYERKKKIWSAEDYIHDPTGANRFLKLTPSVSSLKIGKQYLPMSFVRANELINPGMITLVDKNRAEWSMKLNLNRKNEMSITGNDWKSFCAANEVGAGKSFTLELIRGGTNPVLKFCSMMEQPPLEAETHAHKRARVETCIQKKKQKVEIREMTVAEGETSRRPTTSNKSSANERNLQHTRPNCGLDQVVKVKQIVIDTFNTIKLFQAELERMEQKLEDSLQELNNLEKEKGNGNNTTS